MARTFEEILTNATDACERGKVNNIAEAMCGYLAQEVACLEKALEAHVVSDEESTGPMSELTTE